MVSRSLSIRVMIALLISSLVTAATADRLVAKPQNSRCTVRPEATGKPSHLKFKNTFMGEMFDQQAASLGFATYGDRDVHLGFTGFRASDGVSLTSIHAQFASPTEAQRYFEVVVGRSSKILTRDSTKDNHGNIIGVRAEVILTQNATAKTQYGVLWTSGPSFREIDSSSLDDALALQGAMPDSKENKHSS